MQDSPILHEFRDYLAYEKHFSAHTVKCYTADLKQFSGFLLDRQDQPTSGLAHESAVGHEPHSGGTPATAVAVDLTTLILRVDVHTLRTFLAQLTEEG